MSIKTLKDLRRLALDVHLLAVCMSLVGFVVLIQHPTIDRYGFVNGEAALVVLFALLSLPCFANGLVLISRAVDAVTFVLFLSVLAYIPKQKRVSGRWARNAMFVCFAADRGASLENCRLWRPCWLSLHGWPSKARRTLPWSSLSPSRDSSTPIPTKRNVADGGLA